MLRRIQAFVLDDRERWVAELECGHHTAVPPDAHPPAPEWARSEHGRKNLVGSHLECPACLAAPVGSRVSEDQRPQARASTSLPWWLSFWVRPKAPRAGVEPLWLDAKVASGTVESVQDLERLAELGFRDVLTLNEAGEPGPALAPLVEASWVRTLRMTPHWVPVDPTRIRAEDVDRFLELVDGAEGPVLVHSNGPERATAFATIWYGVAKGLGAPQALRAAAAAGLGTGRRCAELVAKQLGRLRAQRDVLLVPVHKCADSTKAPHVADPAGPATASEQLSPSSSVLES
ncbi:MAG: DUF3565 domain-containing protein [Planctomycetota bacterium]|nr:DUF3565 domain-containing protein [Planctomycetota bacterium]